MSRFNGKFSLAGLAFSGPGLFIRQSSDCSVPCGTALDIRHELMKQVTVVATRVTHAARRILAPVRGSPAAREEDLATLAGLAAAMWIVPLQIVNAVARAGKYVSLDFSVVRLEVVATMVPNVAMMVFVAVSDECRDKLEFTSKTEVISHRYWFCN